MLNQRIFVVASFIMFADVLFNVQYPRLCRIQLPGVEFNGMGICTTNQRVCFFGWKVSKTVFDKEKCLFLKNAILVVKVGQTMQIVVAVSLNVFLVFVEVEVEGAYERGVLAASSTRKGFALGLSIRGNKSRSAPVLR